MEEATNAKAALGNLKRLPDNEKRFLHDGLRNQNLFRELAKPDADDWLSTHSEKAQSIEAWRKKLQNTIPHCRSLKKKIYLVPLDKELCTSDVICNKQEEREKFLTLLQRFASVFFKGFTIEILTSYLTAKLKFRSRINEFSGKRQLFIPDIYKYLESKFAQDAYCMVGVTMVDLYPKESWNFVFGQAYASRGVGVFSFARYDPSFYEIEENDDEFDINNNEDDEVFAVTRAISHTSTLVLWRSCKVMCHEICHLFCLSHCVYFSCAMNGSNHLEEANRRPMFLCPVCLVKLKSTKLNFDIKERYAQMLKFFKSIEDENFACAAEWVEKTLEHL